MHSSTFTWQLSFFFGCRGIVHPPSDDEDTERTCVEPEQRPRKRVPKRSVHGKQFPQEAREHECHTSDRSIPADSVRKHTCSADALHRDIPRHTSQQKLSKQKFFVLFFLWVTGELSTLRQMMKVPNEPGLSPNNGLKHAFLSDQSMASNPRKGQAKHFGAKTTSHDGKAGHVMTHVCHRARQEQRQV